MRKLWFVLIMFIAMSISVNVMAESEYEGEWKAESISNNGIIMEVEQYRGFMNTTFDCQLSIKPNQTFNLLSDINNVQKIENGTWTATENGIVMSTKSGREINGYIENGKFVVEWEGLHISLLKEQRIIETALDSRPDDLPFYVSFDPWDSNDTAQSVRIEDYQVSLELETDADAMDYLLYDSKTAVLYDNGKRFVLIGDQGLFLGVKNGNKAQIHCALKDRKSFSVVNSIPFTAIDFGKNLLFSVPNKGYGGGFTLYTLDWDKIALYRIGDFISGYGSAGTGYYVAINNTYAYIFNRIDGSCWMTGIPYGCTIRRLTEQGAVLYPSDGSGEYYYLSLSDATCYRTTLSGKIYMAADDYYVREDDYSVNAYLSDNTKETIVKKTEMDCFRNDSFRYGSADNVMWFGAEYHGSRTYRLHNTWEEGGDYLTRYSSYSPDTLFPRVDFSDSTIWSDWKIFRVGTSDYKTLSEQKLNVYDTVNYYFSETDYGYIGSQMQDFLSGKSVYYRLTKDGYFVFYHDENKLEKYYVEVAKNPVLSAVREAGGSARNKSSDGKNTAEPINKTLESMYDFIDYMNQPDPPASYEVAPSNISEMGEVDGKSVNNDNLPKESNYESAKSTNSYSFEITGSGGKISQIPSQLSATSYITSTQSEYPPSNMTDGNEETSWQFSTKKTKLGEAYAYFYFDSPVSIDEVWIKNGFWKYTNGYDQYTRNSRVEKMGIAFQYDGQSDYTDKQTIKLKDDKARKDWQKIALDRHDNVVSVRIRVISIYKGTKFKSDVCVSEIMFVENPAIQ